MKITEVDKNRKRTVGDTNKEALAWAKVAEGVSDLRKSLDDLMKKLEDKIEKETKKRWWKKNK